MSSEISTSFLTLNNILSSTFQSGSSEDGLPGKRASSCGTHPVQRLPAHHLPLQEDAWPLKPGLQPLHSTLGTSQTASPSARGCSFRVSLWTSPGDHRPFPSNLCSCNNEECTGWPFSTGGHVVFWGWGQSCGWRAQVLAALVCGMGVGREVELAMSDWQQSDSL